MKRLWRKFRTRRLRGWNPWYSPSMAFYDGMPDVREAVLEGMRATQEVLDQRQLDTEEIEEDYMNKEWECDDFEDAVKVMKALEELGFKYVFRVDTVPCPHPLYQDQRAPRYLVTLLEDPEEGIDG